MVTGFKCFLAGAEAHYLCCFFNPF